MEVPTKEKDVEQIIRYLTTAFNKAKAGTERAFRPKTGKANEAYIMETEFAYLLNELTQGPRCTLQKNIAACNDFIDQVITHLATNSPSPAQE